MKEFEDLARQLELAGLRGESEMTRRFAKRLKLPPTVLDAYTPQINEFKQIASQTIDAINPAGKNFEERRRMIEGFNRLFHDMVSQTAFRVNKETIKTYVTAINLPEVASVIRNAFSKTLPPDIMPTHILPGKPSSAEWPFGIFSPREIGLLTDMYSLSGSERKSTSELEQELVLGSVGHIQKKGLKTLQEVYGETLREKGFVDFQIVPRIRPGRMPAPRA